LSGGEQQRAALVKILLTNPKLLLLDEPTKGLDCFFKEIFADILCKLKTQGITIVMVSHDVEFCARHADRIGMFFDGALMSTNTPRRFFSQNSFYTTAANRMSRHLFPNAITNEDVIALCRENGLAVLPSDAAADGGRR
jgi:energy-coupling factor transport system ATP-binding protein